MLIIKRFLDQVRTAPSATAISDQGGSLTYGELADRAETLAGKIRKVTGSPEPVIIDMPKGRDMVVAIMGVLMAGCCYVPLTPGMPASRKRSIVEDCGASLMLVPGEVGRECCLPVQVDMRDAGRRVSPVAETLTSGDLAAILYTSGSTGKPKGVMLSRRGYDLFVEWAIGYFDLGRRDVIASHAPFAFDISILDLLGGLAAGAQVSIVPQGQMANGRYLVEFVQREGITFWQSVPSPLVAMAGETERTDLRLFSLRHVASTGESIPAAAFARLGRMAPEATLHNIYGCTETNDSFVFSCAADEVPAESPVPAGHPLPFVKYRIVDENLESVKPGTPGELLVSSPLSFIGYTDPGLTEASCVTLEGRRYFRTRDRVVRREGEPLTFIRRTDSTVKVRGFRVDLAEVDACLASMPGVREAVTVTVSHPARGRDLVGVISADDPEGLTPVALKIHCAKHLPRQSVPAWFHIQRHPLSRNGNGKIDRRAISGLMQEISKCRLEREGGKHAHAQ